jgi:hypothetical protein
MSTNAAGTGKTVTVRLEAAETEWEIAPGHVVPGYGFNGQVPGGNASAVGPASHLYRPVTRSCGYAVQVVWRLRRTLVVTSVRFGHLGSSAGLACADPQITSRMDVSGTIITWCRPAAEVRAQAQAVSCRTFSVLVKETS